MVGGLSSIAWQTNTSKRPIIEVIKCAHCHEENAPIAIYASKFGSVLGPEKRLSNENEELRQRLTKLEVEKKRKPADEIMSSLLEDEEVQVFLRRKLKQGTIGRVRLRRLA